MGRCCSEKEEIDIGFCMELDSDDWSIEALRDEWIYEGIADSFWENRFEFDPGIKKAKLLWASNAYLTFKQALYNVFGNFSIQYIVDGKSVETKLGFDVNQEMYNMLEKCMEDLMPTKM